MNMTTANIKHSAIELIEGLPDDAGYEDIMYSLYVRQKIDAGINAISEGRSTPHEEIKDRFAKWLKK